MAAPSSCIKMSQMSPSAPPCDVEAGRQEPDRVCRICYDTGGADLIAPCQCDGSVKWIHRSCLDHWRVDGQNSRAFTHCPNCAFAYILMLQRPPTESEQHLNERRRSFLRRTVASFFIVTVSVQVYLCFVAFLIRLCDPKQALVDFFDLPQIEAAPDELSLWNSIRFHKATYYLSAVLLTLFVVGVGACVVALMNCCRRTRTPQARDFAFVDPCPCPNDPLGNYMCARSCADCTGCCNDGCFLCCRDGGCPNCECPTNTRCPDGCDCGDCNGGAAGAAIVAIVVAFIFIGLVVAMVAFVTWCQKVAQRYFQLRELRMLTGEYIVQDLSECAEICAPSAPSLPPGSYLAPMTEPVVQQSLTRDMQAVYGLSA